MFSSSHHVTHRKFREWIRLICAVVEVLLECFLSFFTVAASRVTRQNVGTRPFDPNGSNDSSAAVTHTLMMLPGLPLQHWPCFYKQDVFHSNWSISKPSRHHRSLASSTTKTEAFAFLFCGFVNFKRNFIVACGEDQFSCSLFFMVFCGDMEISGALSWCLTNCPPLTPASQMLCMQTCMDEATFIM